MSAIPPASSSPPDAQVRRLVAQAAQFLEQGRLAEAERQIQGALALVPQDVDALRAYATLLRQRGRHVEAIAALRRALAQRPDDPALLNSLGIATQAAGDLAASIAAFRRACDNAPPSAVLQANLGKALVDAGDTDAGAEALEVALDLEPALTQPRFTLAYAHRVRGRVADAEAQLRAILRARPHDGDAWLALADLDARLDDADVARMQDAMIDATVVGRSRIALGFALARVQEALGRYSESWSALTAANAAARRLEPWDAAAAHADVDATLAAFASAADVEAGERGREVIFIVGLPRSGSTLIEQILASHPKVEGAGELSHLPAVLDAESRRRGAPLASWAAQASAADWERLGNEYLARTQRWRETKLRSTDKLPSNWRRLGALRRMLPGARIVVCRRDPVETAIACFARLFAPNTQRFSYDLDDIASYWRDFDATIRHGSAQWPDASREQSHEALLADPETEIRALLAFCGLEFDAACLAPHETRRLVHTHSATQVREPLRSARLRAPHYGDLLDPLRAALSRPRASS